MEKLEIVNLIENNLFTKLFEEYNNKFLLKIKQKFTEKDQHFFVSYYYCYLNYNQEKDFIIDLDDIWNWLGYNQKVKAKNLLEKKFIVNKDYKILSSNKNEQKKMLGGYNKEIIMITIKTFKLLCLKAETKKAHDIHEYYIKLEKLMQEIIQEESNELKEQLSYIKLDLDLKNTEIDHLKKEIAEKDTITQKDIDKKVAKEREQMLLREFGTIGAIVYIIKVKSYDNGQYVIKIGESRKGIQARYNEHKTKFGPDILLLDCFSVKKSKEFEMYLHNQNDIKFNRVTDLEGHENEKELFLVGKNLTYKMIHHIITGSIKFYNEYTEGDFEKLKVENYMLKQIIEMAKQAGSNVVDNRDQIQKPKEEIIPEYKTENECEKNTQKEIKTTIMDSSLLLELLNNQKETLEQIKTLQKTIQTLEATNKQILEKINVPKTTTNFNEPLVTLGPRLQQINPENMTLIKVHESVTECMKEFNFKIKRPSINKAIAENTVYQGFRWIYIDRDKDPTVIENIENSKKTKVQNLGTIAKLNKEKNKILNLYLDRKTASVENNYASTSTFENHVKNGTLTHDHYYVLYDKCDDLLKNNFTKEYGKEPILYKDGVGQFDHQQKLVQEFVSKYDCSKKLNISDKTLSKALDKDVMYNHFYYKRLESKIKCF
jgi:hypothetical protein